MLTHKRSWTGNRLERHSGHIVLEQAMSSHTAVLAATYPWSQFTVWKMKDRQSGRQISSHCVLKDATLHVYCTTVYHQHSGQIHLTRASRGSYHNNALSNHHNDNHELQDISSFFSNSLSNDKETDEKDCVQSTLKPKTVSGPKTPPR